MKFCCILVYIDHIFMATSFIERMHYLLIVSISALSALTTNVVVNLLHVQRSWSFIIIVVISGTTFSAFIDIFLSFLKIFLKNQNLLGIYTKHTHTCDTIFTFDGDYKLSAYNLHLPLCDNFCHQILSLCWLDLDVCSLNFSCWF